jgi:predicted RNA-binding protein with PIN domain
VSYLIDGSNLGGVAGGARGARDAEAVVRWLLPWARSRARVILVFDGPPQPKIAQRYGSVEVRFAAPESGDALIERLLGRSGKGWTVVTEDAALARTCRDLGAKVLAASQLIVRTGKVHATREREREKPEASAADHAYWRRIFGGED